MKKGLVFVVVMVLSLAVWGCAKNYSTELAIDMMEFQFNPEEFTVPAGQEITVDLSNSGAVEHEIVIIMLGEEVTMPFSDDDEDKIYWEHELAAGGAETVTFTAPTEPGEYHIVCGIPGHMEGGMTGKLLVVSP